MSASDKPVDDKPVNDTPADQPAADSSSASSGTDQYGRQIFEVSCSSCGNKAQVPFKPSGDRPVYCRDCYMQQRRGGPRRDGGGGGGMSRGPRR